MPREIEFLLDEDGGKETAGGRDRCTSQVTQRMHLLLKSWFCGVVSGGRTENNS